MARYDRYKHKKFHKLEMLHKSRSGGANVGLLWIAQCDCGNVLEVVARDVRAGKKKSCGNCHTRLGISPYTGTVPKGRRAEFRRLIREAGGPGPHIQLSTSEFVGLCGKPCVICERKDTESYWYKQKCEYNSQSLVALCKDCKDNWNGDNIAKFLQYILRAAQCIRNRIPAS